MKIGILVYSDTGNTLSVAEKIKKQIEKNGDSAAIERLTATKTGSGSDRDVQLLNIPDVSGYDKLVIGAPINGLMLCRPMQEYLAKHADLKGKDINCYVTQYFKRSIFGGTNGINHIKNQCAKKGGNMINTADIHWSSKAREEEIASAAELMAKF
ncbi:MAG: flavodoxin [Clostridia bacterium]|nr:flavodoxin [Clostridia bacterium]